MSLLPEVNYDDMTYTLLYFGKLKIENRKYKWYSWECNSCNRKINDEKKLIGLFQRTRSHLHLAHAIKFINNIPRGTII